MNGRRNLVHPSLKYTSLLFDSESDIPEVVAYGGIEIVDCRSVCGVRFVSVTAAREIGAQGHSKAVLEASEYASLLDINRRNSRVYRRHRTSGRGG